MATATEAYANSPQAKKYGVGELNERYRQAKVARERYIPDWVLNLSMYLGKQWVYWNRGRLDTPILAPYRETLVDNRILPAVTSRAARKVKNRPVFVATPFTADEEDIGAAKIGEKVLESDWRALGLQERLFQAILFSEIATAGFWKIYWDSTKGPAEDFLFDAQGNAVTGPDGRPLRADAMAQVPEGLTVKRVAIGDVCVDVLSPFEFFPDPLATSLADCEWAVEEKVRSVEYVKKRYGETLKADAAAPIGPVEGRLFESAFYSPDTAGGEYKGVKVYEFWSRPSTDFPEGKRCVWAQDQLLAEDNQPFDPMPYVMFGGINVPSRFWPTAITTQLRPVQTALNKLLSQIQENANRIGNPAIMKSRQANVHYTGLPGEEVMFDSTVPDAKPDYLTPPEVPAYLREHVQRLYDAITEISGVHEVSKGNIPTGLTAASAINLLQEADDTRIGPEIQDMEKALADAGTKILKLRAEYNSDTRLIRIAGEDGNWDIQSFRGAMLRESTDVEVQAGSALPRSKAAKQAAMLEILQLAFQYGIPLDPRDLRDFLKDYEVAGLDKLFAGVGRDEMQTNRENRLMSQGQALNINSYDDDEYHISAHEDFEKSLQFTQLPEAIQNLIQTHVNAHRERQVQAVNQQMQAQQQEQVAQQQMDTQQQLMVQEAQFQGRKNAVRNAGQ